MDRLLGGEDLDEAAAEGVEGVGPGDVRCRLTELNWVSTKIRFRPEWMQLEIGMSISRYLPAIGTAGLLRDRVRG